MAQKRLGVWMDHSNATILDFSSGEVARLAEFETEFTKEEQEKALMKSENIMHNKQQQKQGEYYAKIMTMIKDYDDVLLFGPTNAKVELFNVIKADKQFDDIKIATQDADYITPNQKDALVRDYFSNKKN